MSRGPGHVASIVDCLPGGPGSNPGSSEKKSFFHKFVKKGGKFEILWLKRKVNGENVVQ